MVGEDGGLQPSVPSVDRVSVEKGSVEKGSVEEVRSAEEEEEERRREPLQLSPAAAPAPVVTPLSSAPLYEQLKSKEFRFVSLFGGLQ